MREYAHRNAFAEFDAIFAFWGLKCNAQGHEYDGGKEGITRFLFEYHFFIVGAYLVPVSKWKLTYDNEWVNAKAEYSKGSWGG